MGYPAGYYYANMAQMPDQEPHLGVTKSQVTLCCVQIKAGDLVDFRYDPSSREQDRHTIRAVFLGQQTDGHIVVADVRSTPGTVLQRDRIIDVHIVSSAEEDYDPDDQ